jgi:hypothetical protein
MPALPLTNGGKIDRRAPAGAVGSGPDRTLRSAPQRPERTLADVWAASSAARRWASTTSSSLGGDSIPNIQVIARCRQAGLSRRATCSNSDRVLPMAVVVGGASPAGQPRVVGDAADRERTMVFDRGRRPRSLDQAHLLQVPAGLDLGALDAALAAVVAQHDASGCASGKPTALRAA